MAFPNQFSDIVFHIRPSSLTSHFGKPSTTGGTHIPSVFLQLWYTWVNENAVVLRSMMPQILRC
jgi:hypothetical protein